MLRQDIVKVCKAIIVAANYYYYLSIKAIPMLHVSLVVCKAEVMS